MKEREGTQKKGREKSSGFEVLAKPACHVSLNITSSMCERNEKKSFSRIVLLLLQVEWTHEITHNYTWQACHYQSIAIPLETLVLHSV